MNEVFANAQWVRFGQSSEKASYVMGEDQMSLFNEAEKCQDHEAEEPTEETFTVKAHMRKKKKTIDEKDLPVEEVLLKLPEFQLVCGKCGGTFKPIGKEFVRRELQIIPRQVKILPYYTVTYACDKYEKDTGFAHADETAVQVLKEDNKPAVSKSRMWLYASGERSGTPARIFEYQPDRKGKRPKEFLRGFTGCLVTDGYSGYNSVENVTHCSCWAHMKRKWREAMPDGATVKTSKAAI